MKFSIHKRTDNSVLFEIEAESFLLAVEAAMKSGADLREADLRGADLREADLCEADLHGADLSGAIGLLDPIEWIGKLETDSLGVIVYKRIGDTNTNYQAPGFWIMEPGRFLTEVVNQLPTLGCACGVNFGTLEWCEDNYPKADLWKCRIRWLDLVSVVVPYNSDGQARCGRLELLEKINA